VRGAAVGDLDKSATVFVGERTREVELAEMRLIVPVFCSTFAQSLACTWSWRSGT
jgi:hypothetical protein